MRSWVPVPGTAKGRLVEVALREFGARGWDGVGVAEVARAADVTTGSLYHHFGSKVGLYSVVREDVERRLLDRLEGAAAVAPDDLGRVLLVGWDYLVGAGFARLLAEPHPDRADDPVAQFVAAAADRDGVPVSPVLIAAWRAGLRLGADDVPGARDAVRQVLAR